MLSRATIEDAIDQASLPQLMDMSRVSGGSINDSYHCRLDNGREVFAKINRHAPADFFQAEADGLAALAASKTLPVPAVLHCGKDCLLLEYLAPAPMQDDYWQRLGHGLAKVHTQEYEFFGYTRSNYCGSTVQPNPTLTDGHDFFAEHRLLYQTSLARGNNLLEQQHCRKIERLCHRLPTLIPAETPRLLHGDLWSGNIHRNSEGYPVLIDPACHWGWREADIAMTRLFGGLPDTFYQSYCNALPLQHGWHERMDLYNLYHLLNHLNLFGESYLHSVEAVLRRFVD